jgi:hypothetical protein
MSMSSDLSWIPQQSIYYVASALLAILVGAGGYVIKSFKRDWDGAIGKLDTIENIIHIQAENHLQTIQAEVVKHTTILETMRDDQRELLGSIKTDQRELLGSIKTDQRELLGELLCQLRTEIAETNGYLKAVVDLNKNITS